MIVRKVLKKENKEEEQAFLGIKPHLAQSQNSVLVSTLNNDSPFYCSSRHTEES